MLAVEWSEVRRLDEFPTPRPEPGGSRQPPDRPPRTAVGLGGEDGDEQREQQGDRRSHSSAFAAEVRRRGFRIEALGIAKDLFEIAKRIAFGAKNRPDLESDFLELQRDCLALIDKALELARGS